MSQNQKSRIPVRPHTVAGAKGDDDSLKREIEVQFTSHSTMESVTNLNDAFATGDAADTGSEAISRHPTPERQDEKKIPLFKQSMINCSLIESRAMKATMPQKKYVPNYKKELGHPKPVPCIGPKKRISIPDELKTYEEPFPECGLAEQITQDIQRQMEELKQDSCNVKVSNDPPKQNLEILTDTVRIKEIEARLTELERKLESLIELLYDNQLIKGTELKIKLEEYNLEKLNTSLRLCNAEKPDQPKKTEDVKIIAEDSDPSVFKEIYYETRQKHLNLQEKSEESLKLNKIPVLQRVRPVFEPHHGKYMSLLKSLGNFNCKPDKK